MKFPVFKAYLATLAYLSAHILTVVKILWLPTLLMMAALVYFMPSIADAQIQIAAMEESGDPAEALSVVGPMMGSVGLLYLAMAIVYPMMLAGVLRHVVRGESPGLPFYLRFAGDELHILGALVLLIVMIVLLSVVGVLAVMVLSMLLAALSPALAAIAPLVFLIVLIWFMTRMSVVFAAGVGARSFGIAESWRLTKANFWGLLAYWIFWFIFICVVAVIYMMIAAGDYLALMSEMFAAAGDKAALQDIQQRMMQMQRDMWDASRPGFWIYAVATYVYTVVNTAVWAAAGGVAYRYLSDGK